LITYNSKRLNYRRLLFFKNDIKFVILVASPLKGCMDFPYQRNGREASLFAYRGFTGHEYLEDFKLYNMNGRLYDPVVGRFLNADPFVQDPGNTQSYNRYSYCLNNPLKFTDPSGEAIPAFMLWPISWGGNWLIGGLDRWLNGKQPFKQAFSVTKNPVVFSGNYSPSANKFSNPQVEAQMGARHEEFVAQQLDKFVTSQRGAGSPSWGGDKLLYTIGTGLNVAGFAASAGEYSNVVYGSWRGINGEWYSTSWWGNQWTGAKSSVVSRAGAFRLASRSFFYAGALISGYQGFSAFQSGDYEGAAKSGFDIGIGAYATFGGPPGWIIGGGYFTLDAFGTFNHQFTTTPYRPFYYAEPDNTYVAPPIILPLR
jgi:RHS repeat-associated protein